MIPIYQLYIGKYKSSALKAIESEWISNHGIYVDLATDTLKTIIGNQYCILMNNGTSATHCLYKALKFKHPDIKKIYIPNYVFIAPWNCGLQEYDALMFEVMKTDPTTLNICTDKDYIMSLDASAAVVIVHNLGNIVNIPRLKRLRPDLVFIEDNCEGLFGKYEGQFSGTASLCSAVSFYGNKTITTGEGGAFFTNDIAIYKYIKTYFSHGMSDIRYVHNILGTNYRMTNVQAGFLYDQLNDISHILELKNTIYRRYEKLFAELIDKGKAILFKNEEGTEHSKWMFTIVLPNVPYSDLEKYLLEKQIQIRPLFYHIQAHKHLQDIKISDDCKIAAIENGLMLPSYPSLLKEQQQYIFNSIKEYMINNNI